MSSNLSTTKNERDLLNRIAKLEAQMRECGTTQIQGYDALQIRLSPLYDVTFNSILDSTGFQLTKSLAWDDAPPSGNILMSTFEFAIYRNSVDSSGWVNVNNPNYVSFNYWRDQRLPDLYANHGNGNGSYPTTDNVNVWNNTGGTWNFYVYYRWRYILTQGDMSGVNDLPDPPDGPS